MRLLLAVVLLVLAGGLAQAERRVAIVFGADAYRTLRPLGNAVNDARAIRDALEALGFDVALERNRDLAGMRRAIAEFGEDARGADVALVFFAGHGVEIAGENRLLPVDADAASLESMEGTSLPLDEVSRVVARAGRIGLLVLDACRTDPFGAEGAGKGRGAVSISPELRAAVRPGLGRVGRAENMLFAFAAAPGQAAEDGEAGNSPFTAALVRHLGRPGLEIRSVLTLVQQDVYDVSRGRQLPYVESGLPRAFFAVEDAAPVPERERLLLAMADLTPDLRMQVEQVASDAGVPLAPLYGALIGAGGASGSISQRDAMLREAAENYAKVRDAMLTLGAADPQVARLRREAAEQLALGAFETARTRFSEAAAIDRSSRETLRDNYVQRTLSEAATRFLSAGAARADLAYDRAISDLETARSLFIEADRNGLPPEHADRRLQALLALGDLYRTVGNIGASARTYAELRSHAQDRLGDDPADPAVRRDLGVIAMKLGNAELTLGRLDDALAHLDEARGLLSSAIEAEPREHGWPGDLARALDSAGGIRMMRGDLQAAFDAFSESLAIRTRRAASGPDDLGLQRDLTVSYDYLGDVMRLAGDWRGARDAYERSLEVRRRIAAARPDDMGAQRDLSISLDKTGDVLRDAGDADGALRAYREAGVIVERLAARDPADTELMRDASVSLSKIGNALRDLKDYRQALDAYRASLAEARRLAMADPDNADWQRDLSVSIEKVGDILNKQGDHRGAFEAFEESLLIVRSLAARDPSNLDWQRDLSITLGEIGNLRILGGDARGARRDLKQSLEIRERLAESDPGNALWQRDLVIACADYSRVAPDPRVVLARALRIARMLEQADRMAPAHRVLVDYIEARLAGLHE